MDFMSDALWNGRRFRTFNVVDDFNREALCIEIDLNLPAARVVRALERLAAWRGYPAKVRMDNGPEFIGVALAEWAEQHEVALDSSNRANRCRTVSSNGSIAVTGKECWICMYSTKLLKKPGNGQKPG